MITYPTNRDISKSQVFMMYNLNQLFIFSLLYQYMYMCFCSFLKYFFHLIFTRVMWFFLPSYKSCCQTRTILLCYLLCYVVCSQQVYTNNFIFYNITCNRSQEILFCPMLKHMPMKFCYLFLVN